MQTKIQSAIYNISLLVVGALTATSSLLPTWIRILAAIVIILYIALFLTSVVVLVRQKMASKTRNL
ncbi:hypothetical protein LCGC14_0422390 [marine sediment metagenome]|uniref:Uncharacterized protein n=1 Tax=marine sediment metagenome TaxID=412755 RepID=A0A0F9SWS9_9ZZZZ